MQHNRGTLWTVLAPFKAPYAMRGPVTHMHCCAVLKVAWRCICQLLSLRSPAGGVILAQHPRC